MTNSIRIAAAAVLLLTCCVHPINAAEQLKVHGIFRSNMVLQRDKPIKIWGWAPAGSDVSVSLGNTSKTTRASGDQGRWEVVFDARAAHAEPQILAVKAGDQTITMDNILIGDVWVMNGQSNMAFGLRAVYQSQFEAAMAHLPLMRHIRINSGAESEHLEKDLRDEFINGQNEDKNWKVVTPEVALEMGAIGYVFGSRLQRALQIPIGIIDNARGGASLESLVPRHKFAEHPQAAAYLAWVDQRNREFSEQDFLKQQMDKWEIAEANYQKAIEEDKKKGVTRNRRRPRNLTAPSVPGRSPVAAPATPLLATTACSAFSKG